MFSFISCTQDTIPDIKLDEDTGDTLQVLKRYPSTKPKELLLYKYNLPFGSWGFSEKGDTLKIPRVMYVKNNHTLFLYIPIQENYSRVALLFEKTATSEKSFDSTLTIEARIIKSMDIPVTEKMIHGNNIRGFIKTMSLDEKTITYWPFKLAVDK